MRSKAIFSIPIVVLAVFAVLSKNHSVVGDAGIDVNAPAEAETHEFQSEISRLMKLIINSLYQKKEIFLRELISNASDALDKVRFKSVTDSSMLGHHTSFNITIVADKDAKTLTITDSGIGMTKEELKKNLGTIAKSGTADFLSQLSKTDDVGQIGQFGVGFYSSYLVSDLVTVTSKSNDDEQHIWESNSENGFKIMKDTSGPSIGRGTKIVLKMKEDETEYLEQDKLKGLIQKYSEFINFPIYLYTSNTVKEEVPIPEDEQEAEKVDSKDENAEKDESDKKDDESKSEDDEDEDVSVEDKPEEGEEVEKKPKTKTIEKVVEGFEQINTMKPIWTRPISSITVDDYNGFYRTFTKDTSDPLSYIHFKAEGGNDFKTLLYIPKKAPFNIMASPNPELYLHNIKLFVKRVFITDELIDFIPRYLGFLKGLIDSDDMPLNVSRETLQRSKTLKGIKNKVVSKAIEMLRNLSEDEEKWEEFLKEYSMNLKFGVLEDSKNADKLIKLLRFKTSDDVESTTLEGYVSRMKKGQKDIFYMAGSSVDSIKKSPFLEALISRGYEVLYMIDPVDEHMLQRNTDYDGKKFQNAAKSGLKFGDEDENDKKSEEELKSQYKPLISYLEKTFSDRFDKVVITNRLTNSPLAVVAGEYGGSPAYERMMLAQSKANDPMVNFMLGMKKVLEINPHHPVVATFLSLVEDEKMNDEKEDLVRVLVDSAMIGGGWHVADGNTFAERMEKAVRLGLGVDLAAKPYVSLKPAPALAYNENEEGDEDGEEKKGADEVAASEEEEDVAEQIATHDEEQEIVDEVTEPAKEDKVEEPAAEKDEL